MLEGMPPPILQGPIPFQSSLGTIPEVPSSVERESKQAATSVVAETQIQEEENVVQEHNEEQQVTTADFGDEIPEVEEIIAREMWDAVKQKIHEEALSSQTPPFSIVDFTGRPTVEVEAMPYWDDQGSEDLFLSKHTLQTMPSYLGEYEPKSVVMRVPSVWNNKKKEHDNANLHTLMSAPITCTLPLMDVLKVRPELWESVAKRLQDVGLWNKELTLDKVLKTNTVVSRHSIKAPIQVNKVGEKAEDDEGNTTLPVTINNVKSIAILDSGAEVGIATKSIWESWGKPAIWRTRMSLQLADGSLEHPLGLLEDVKVKSCGIEYLQTFAIVDFGKNTNYEVILGRPFMRQFQMIQDWGYNYLYLRHEGVITRINLKNHEYRDVTHSLVEEFDSASSESIEKVIGKATELWMCGSSCVDLKFEEVKDRREVQDDAYIPMPFPEDELEPQEWLHALLSTLDVCALPKQTKFVDPDGYDIIPIRMTNASQQKEPSKEEYLDAQNKMEQSKDVSEENLSQSEYDTPESDEENKDKVIPIWMIRAINREEPLQEGIYVANANVHQGDMVSVRDITPTEEESTSGNTDRYLDSSEGYDSDDSIVPEEELEKIRVLLRGREGVDMKIPRDKPKRKFCKSHRKF